ncbi:uncharacterized protein PY1_contig-12-76 [Novosphingobium sp. PY1]|nr:uncharacterized protein PY1_contig-12-76 [Novosphingobium sp. PY1]
MRQLDGNCRTEQPACTPKDAQQDDDSHRRSGARSQARPPPQGIGYGAKENRQHSGSCNRDQKRFDGPEECNDQDKSRDDQKPFNEMPVTDGMILQA